MKNVLLLLVVFLSGCGGSEFSLVPVSGTVTFDGQPLEGAEVVFAPMASQDEINVGPVSVAQTDASGQFALATAKGEAGAVVTKHRVSIGFKGINQTEVSRKVEEAYSKNRSMSEREINALERKIRQSMKRELKGQIDVPKSYNKRSRLTFDVTGPMENADFALNSDGSL